MNGLFKLLDKTSLTGSFFQQLIDQLKKLETETTQKYRKGSGDGTNDATGWIDEIVRIRQKLEILRTACNLSIDPHAGLNDLADLGTAFGYEIKVDLVPKTAEPPKTARLVPHPHGKPVEVESKNPKKVLCVGDYVTTKDSTTPDAPIIACLEPLVLVYNSDQKLVGPTHLDLGLLEVVGHAIPEELSRARRLLTPEQYAASDKLTRIEV